MKFKIQERTIQGHSLTIELSLADDCKNGYMDFHMTGEVYQKGKARIDRYCLECGCIHDTILKVRPDLKIFADLHGCDFNGMPSFGLGNVFYHLRNKFNSGHDVSSQEHKEQFCEYYRITHDQFEKIKNSPDVDHMSYMFIELGIVDHYKNQANKAIKILEELTENKFVNTSTKQNFNFSEEKKEEIKSKIDSGYYSPENIEARRVKAYNDMVNKKIDDLTEEKNKKIAKIEQDYSFNILLVGMFGTYDNAILYNHTNKIVFNWKEPRFSTYAKKWTKDEVSQFLEVLPNADKLHMCEVELKE